MSIINFVKNKFIDRKKQAEWDRKWRELNGHNFTSISRSFPEEVKVENIVSVGKGTYGYLDVRWFWDKQEKLTINYLVTIVETVMTIVVSLLIIFAIQKFKWTNRLLLGNWK